MRILQINKFFYRRRGAEAYFFDLCELLRKQKHAVAEFSMWHPLNEKSQYSEYFVSNLELNRVKFNPFAAGRIIWSPEAKKKMRQLIYAFKPNIAHVHNIYHQISPSVLFALKEANIPIVMTLHDYKLLCPNYKMFQHGRICEQCRGRHYRNCLKNKCLKNSYAASALAALEMSLHNYLQIYQKTVDCFIAPSKFMHDKVLSWQVKTKRLEIINNFVNPVETRLIASLPNKKYILYFGGLSEEKGVDILIDNFNHISYDIELHIVGAGHQEAYLKQKAQNNKKIIFKGHLSGKELALEIGNCLFTVLPSIWYENYPLAAIESLAYQKPVIASNLGGIPEIIINQQTGLLFDPKIKGDLAEKIKYLVNNPELQKKLGDNGREFVLTKLNAKNHYQKIVKLYEEVMAAN